VYKAVVLFINNLFPQNINLHILITAYSANKPQQKERKIIYIFGDWMEIILAGNMLGNNWKEERKNNCLR
jgi:hypothetical protein